MKLYSVLVKIAGTGLLVVFASTGAVAQGGAAERGAEAVGDAAQATGKAGAEAVENAAQATGKAVRDAVTPWTANNVTAAQPFGDIDVKSAGTSPDSVRTWVSGRTDSERSELSGRCSVINNAANASRYSADAKQFCRNYMTASAASPSKK